METSTFYILAIDVGTTTIRSFIVDSRNNVVGKAIEEIPLLTPSPGYVEQDPLLLWKQCKMVIQNSLKDSKLTAKELTCIGLTNQRGEDL